MGGGEIMERGCRGCKGWWASRWADGRAMVVVGHSGNDLPRMFIKLSAQWTENGFRAG